MFHFLNTGIFGFLGSIIFQLLPLLYTLEVHNREKMQNALKMGWTNLIIILQQKLGSLWNFKHKLIRYDYKIWKYHAHTSAHEGRIWAHTFRRMWNLFLIFWWASFFRLFYSLGSSSFLGLLKFWGCLYFYPKWSILSVWFTPTEYRKALNLQWYAFVWNPV